MLNYQAALINVPFDIDCRNVLRFDNREAQENYFQVASLFLNAQQINFNAGSLLETSIIYNKGQAESLTDLLSKNYCIIKDNSPEATLKYYYYYVKNIMQDSASQVKVLLELDIFQTYYIDLEFTNCEIIRANLNRFIPNEDGTISFNGETNSPLFTREKIKDASKRLISRQKINIYTNLNIPNNIQQWLYDNVLGWVYFYFDPNHGFNIVNEDGSVGENIKFISTKTTTLEGGIIDTRLCAACVPLLKEGSRFTVTNGLGTFGINISSLDRFLNANNQAAYIYAMKISACPPFNNLAQTNNTWTISTDGKTLALSGQWISNTSLTVNYGWDYSKGYLHTKIINRKYPGNGAIFYCEKQAPYIELNVSTTCQYTFNKSDIIGSIKNPKFNPKLLNSDYYGVNIGIENSTFEYDAQKLNTQNIDILYSEPLSPDITKIYIRYKGNNNGIYKNVSSESWVGDVSNNDTSLVLVTDKYQEMLANNKNFYLQNTINRVSGAAQGIMGTGINIAAGNYGAAVSSGVGAIGGFVTSLINEQLTVDNMRSAPSSVQNAKGNILLNAMCTGIGPYLEQYEILDTEKIMINDYLVQYGFSYNKLGNIKDFDNIRKYHNYIEADIQETTGINISRAVHDKFKSAFKNGVRFWNTDSFSYENENYERWLENEN